MTVAEMQKLVVEHWCRLGELAARMNVEPIRLGVWLCKQRELIAPYKLGKGTKNFLYMERAVRTLYGLRKRGPGRIKEWNRLRPRKFRRCASD